MAATGDAPGFGERLGRGVVPGVPLGVGMGLGGGLGRSVGLRLGTGDGLGNELGTGNGLGSELGTEDGLGCELATGDGLAVGRGRFGKGLARETTAGAVSAKLAHTVQTTRRANIIYSTQILDRAAPSRFLRYS